MDSIVVLIQLLGVVTIEDVSGDRTYFDMIYSDGGVDRCQQGLSVLIKDDQDLGEVAYMVTDYYGDPCYHYMPNTSDGYALQAWLLQA
jgi:hypothetical protein